MTKTKRGRKSVTAEDARAIRNRLRRLVERQWGTVYKFKESGWAPASTIAKWFAREPRMPELVYLMRLAQKHNWNLNYLLLGEGPMLREESVPAGDLAGRLRARIVAELKSSGASDPEVAIVVPRVAKRVMDHLLEHYRLGVRSWRAVFRRIGKPASSSSESRWVRRAATSNLIEAGGIISLDELLGKEH